MRCRAAAGENRQVKGSTLSNRQSIEKTLREAGFSIGFGNSPESPDSSLVVPSPSSYTWAEWQELFLNVHEGQGRTAELKEQLLAAVSEERYSEAALLKSALEEAQAPDTVQQAEQELEAAVAGERYEEAAGIRDTTALGLLGWWAGQGVDDPCGHLLHVSKSFGRFTARVYTPSQLAEMKGWTEANPLRQNSKLLSRPPQNLGQLAMEMFLQKNASGSWEQQAVVLQHARAVLQSVRLGSNKLSPQNHLLSGGDEMDSAPANPIGMLRRAPAALMQITRDQFMVVPSAEGNDDAKDVAVSAAAADVTVTATASIRLEANGAAQQRVALDVPLTESMEEAERQGTWGRVAEAIEEMQQQLGPSAGRQDAASREALASSVRAAIEQLAEEGAAAGGVTVDLSTRSVRGSKTVKEGFISEPTTYKRLANAHGSPADPLSGMYLGAFGAHGPEVLSVGRGRMEDGSECVTGVKVTGDVNVPAGQVSFRVNTAPGSKLSNEGMYPRELGVVARYKGQGCVAQPGFTNPKWVDGELLVFGGEEGGGAKGRNGGGSGKGSVTGGAELGFVWTLPASEAAVEGKEGKKFLILMNRVDLDDIVGRSL